MKTYIVIPHYIITPHVAQLAKDAIKSFKETCDCVIISCDDQSPYEDVKFLEEMSDVYIRNEKNLGFAGNCNVGFRWILENVKEDADIVCVNNDIEVYEGWYEEFKRIQGLVGGRIIGGLGYKEKGFPPDKKNANYVSIGGYLEDWMFPGGFYMINKTVLEDYGLYDEGFEHGGYEDIDLFLRWKNAGEKLVIAPRVHYWHEEGATRFSERELKTQNKAEVNNRKYFETKNGFDAHEGLRNFLKDERINF